jgi:hypothetical protein
MTAERCNGWTNYATWNIVLWIDKDEVTYTRKRQWITRFSGRIDARPAEEIAEDCLGGKKTPDLEVDNESIGHSWKDLNWDEIALDWSEEHQPT